LADNVFRYLGRRDELPRDVRAAVRTDRVIEQPLLERFADADTALVSTVRLVDAPATA
jgi:hypothetical protein